MELFFTAVLFFGLGFLFGKNRAEEKKEREISFFRGESGKTNGGKPSLAEQWMNILNYNGESRTEVDYEETDGD